MFSQMDPESRQAALKIWKVAKGMKLEEIRAKEEQLSEDWEERSTPDGHIYYVNLKENITQFEHPKTGRFRTLEGDLPRGWEKRTLSDGRVAFINEIEDKVTYRDPRLAKPKKQPIVEPQEKASKFAAQVTAMEVLSGLDMTGWVIMITGASSGIGFETARSLAAHSAHVIMACRNVDKAEHMKSIISGQMEGAQIDVIECDLSSFESIEMCVKTFLEMELPLHVLICNGAVYGPSFTQTEDTGLEKTFAVNHMGHFYLTKLLTKALIQSQPSQVIVITSEHHRKAAEIGNFKALYALVRPWTKTLKQAAASVAYCVVLPENVGGQYINDCCPIASHEATMNGELQERLWEISEDIVDKYLTKKDKDRSQKLESTKEN